MTICSTCYEQLWAWDVRDYVGGAEVTYLCGTWMTWQIKPEGPSGATDRGRREEETRGMVDDPIQSDEGARPSCRRRHRYVADGDRPIRTRDGHLLAITSETPDTSQRPESGPYTHTLPRQRSQTSGVSHTRFFPLGYFLFPRWPLGYPMALGNGR